MDSNTMIVRPAHAGMIRRRGRTRSRQPRSPRTRGDDPSWGVEGLSAAMFAPHTRG